MDVHDSDVLPGNLRRVWTPVASCARRVGGVLTGGTAVAVHLRHRVSEDLEVMTLRSFSGAAVEERLRETVNSVEPIEVSDNMFHGFLDGVKVDVFRALPTNGIEPDQMRWICPGTRISGMEIGSIPDLMATKLDTIMYRAKLRDYLDLAELDRSGACSLEAGLGYYCRRFGYSYPPPVLERIIRLLESPGSLPADPDYEARSEPSLSYLRERAANLWERLAVLRDQTNSEAHSRRPSVHPAREARRDMFNEAQRSSVRSKSAAVFSTTAQQCSLLAYARNRPETGSMAPWAQGLIADATSRHAHEH